MTIPGGGSPTHGGVPLGDPAPLGAASVVSVDPSGLLVVTGTNVQSAIAELDAAVAAGGGGGGAVASVNGQTGVVVLAAADVGADASGAAAAAITTAEAASNQRASNLSDVADVPTARANLRVPVLSSVQAVSTTNVAPLSGLPTVDGVTLSSGDHVLLAGQTTGTENGPWVVAAGAWTRPNDFAVGLVVQGRSIQVNGGTANGGSLWVMSTTGSVTVGTTSTTWQIGNRTPNDVRYAPLAGKNGLASSRIVGVTTTGAPPTSGTWALGDVVVDTAYGVEYLCTVAGTPGTWVTLGSGRTLALSKTTSPSAAIGSTATELAVIGSITVTAGPLPLVISARTNGITGMSSGALITLAVFDEAFADVFQDSFTAASTTAGRAMSLETTESYPVGTVKTFHLYGRCQTAGTAVFGQSTGSTCTWMKVALG